ncbi:MAG: hypothetical protein WBQ43_20360 [Terriglobales bacterium]
MIVNMSDSATPEQIEHIIQRIREAGFQPHVTRGAYATPSIWPPSPLPRNSRIYR